MLHCWATCGLHCGISLASPTQSPPTLTLSFVVCNRPLLHDATNSVLMSTHHFARVAFDSRLVSTTTFTPQTVVVQNPERTPITFDFDDVDVRLQVLIFEGVEVLPSGGLRPNVTVNGSNELRSLPSVSTTSRTFPNSLPAAPHRAHTYPPYFRQVVWHDSDSCVITIPLWCRGCRRPQPSHCYSFR